MMAQQVQNNIFVRELILQEKDLANQVWASIDWICAKKIRKHNSIGITILGQVWGWSVLIFTQIYLSTRCSFFFLSLITCPIFHGGLSFIWSSYFQSQPYTCWSCKRSFGYLSHQKAPGNFVSSCELDIFAQGSFSHKCSKLVRCRTFNVVVAAFSLYISSFVVGYLPWNLSIKGSITFCTTFVGRLGSNLLQRFPEEAWLLWNYYQLVIILSCPWLIDP